MNRINRNNLGYVPNCHQLPEYQNAVNYPNHSGAKELAALYTSGLNLILNLNRKVLASL